MHFCYVYLVFRLPFVTINPLFFFVPCQTGNAVGAHDDYWKHATQTFQTQHVSSVQSDFQKALDVNSSCPSLQGQQQNASWHVPNSQYTGAPQVQQTYQPSQPPNPVDVQRVNKLQIPTNPRIAPNLAFGLAKSSKDTSTSSVMAKPAYVSVSVPKPNEKVLSGDASDSSLKVTVLHSLSPIFIKASLSWMGSNFLLIIFANIFDCVDQ